MEFLGTTFGKPYVLQTNVYIRGSGDRNIIGREMKFHLWFDPTKGFHHYAIFWSPKEIMYVFFNLLLNTLFVLICFFKYTLILVLNFDYDFSLISIFIF